MLMVLRLIKNTSLPVCQTVIGSYVDNLRIVLLPSNAQASGPHVGEWPSSFMDVSNIRNAFSIDTLEVVGPYLVS